MPQLLGGGFYLMNFFMFRVFCECGFEGLRCEKNVNKDGFLYSVFLKLEVHVLLRLCPSKVYDYVKHVK